MVSRPPLNAIRAFEAATRHSSFAAAAEELGVSTTAISHHIKVLEERLSVKLFRPQGRGLVPTEAGQRFAAVVADAFQRISTGMAELSGEAAVGRLRLSVAPPFAAYWLVPRLVAFRRLHPGIEIEVESTQRPVDFRHNAVDLAIRYGDDDWGGLVAERLMQPVAFPVCVPELAASLAVPADLKAQPLLHEDSNKLWLAWLSAAGVDGVDLNRGPRFSDVILLMEAIAAGQGVGLGDSLCSVRDLGSGRVVRPFDIGIPCDWYWLIMPPGRRLSAAAGNFRAWLLDQMPDAAE